MKSSVLGMTLMSIVTSMGLLHPLNTYAAFINYSASVGVRGEVGNSSGTEDSFDFYDTVYAESGTSSRLESATSSTGHLSSTSASTTTLGADSFSFSGSSSIQATIDESYSVLQIASSRSWFQWEFDVTEYTTINVNLSGLIPGDTSISTSYSWIRIFDCNIYPYDCVRTHYSRSYGGTPYPNENISLLLRPGTNYFMDGGIGTELETITTSGSNDVNWSVNVSSTLGPIPPEVPIPAAAWLFGSGLLGLIGVARRKKA